MDEPAVRKSVERVLSKVENSNKFAKAISHGNNGTGHPAAADQLLLVWKRSTDRN